MRVPAFLPGIAAALLLAAPAQVRAQAQPTTQETVKDIVFSEAEKRILRDVLGQGRYEATEDGGVRKKADDDRYDDLARGSDGKFYGKKKDKGGPGRAKGRGRGKGLPPGLAKRDKLPPGLQKQLERGGRLPPGLSGNPLPYEAVTNLPPPPQGAERAIVDDDVVLLEKGTGLILDVLEDVLTKQ